MVTSRRGRTVEVRITPTISARIGRGGPPRHCERWSRASVGGIRRRDATSSHPGKGGRRRTHRQGTRHQWRTRRPTFDRRSRRAVCCRKIAAAQGSSRTGTRGCRFQQSVRTARTDAGSPREGRRPRRCRCVARQRFRHRLGDLPPMRIPTSSDHTSRGWLCGPTASASVRSSEGAVHPGG